MALSSSSIVTEARKWLGTRFQHQGRIVRHADLAGGCDCLGLLIGVAKALQLRSRVCDRLGNPLMLADCDESGYGRIPQGHRLHDALSRHLHEVPTAERRAGDVALLHIDANPQHLGILSHLRGAEGLIHAYAVAGKVVEHGLDCEWEKRMHAVFRLADVEA